MRLQFIIGEILVGVRRNIAMVLSLVLVTCVSLYLLSLGLVMRAQVNDMRTYWYDRVQTSIFMCSADDSAPSCSGGAATEDQKRQVEAALESPQLKPYVEKWVFESRQEAYERFQAQFKDSALTDNVSVAQMPESYRIRLKDPNRYQVISEYFSGRDGVQSVQDQNELVKRLFSLINGMKWSALVLAGWVLICSVLLVGVTIRLTAFSRRRETAIMRLVGASDFVIRAPFLLEGVLAATVGAALASAGLWLTLQFGVHGWLATNVNSLRWVEPSVAWSIIPVLFIVGVVSSGVSSTLVLQRYLKV
ncbi:MAG: permease-like cell division protein FtsX [Kineosporiaceae bacterium]